MKIEGKTAIITGASSGFGKALAWRLAGKGGHVVLGDLSAKAGSALKDEINAKYPGHAIFQVCDVASKKDQENLFALAKNQFRSVDIVVNNAGIGENTAFGTDATDSWLPVLRIDLEAVILGTRLALAEMQKSATGGVILNTASLAGLVPVEFQPVYAAAKAGVVNFTKSLTNWKKKGIRVVAICPGFTQTGIIDAGRAAFGDAFYKFVGPQLIPIDLVIDAFVRAIEDDSLTGVAIRITKERGIQVLDQAARL
ncbi:hypothetical protein HDU87_004575 [Geranomyces variabilis]|uniref:Uncharacterized protein n=1 Tax=Geranomyces variabilis TaxID=109894 RepID=A0AAD5TIA8_9FUNG|nr:hypothetical protein HDU87_004575 [Geranomyces variabilis]